LESVRTRGFTNFRNGTLQSELIRPQFRSECVFVMDFTFGFVANKLLDNTFIHI